MGQARRRRLAARQAEEKTRQAQPDRGDIADAVHRAVCVCTGTDGWGSCADYAIVAAAVANKVFGTDRYFPNAGRLVVWTGDDDEGASYLEQNPAASGYNGLEFHAWAIRVPDVDPGPGVHAADDDTEIIDLSSRHYQRTAEAAGITWLRDDMPPYIWAPASELTTTLRVHLQADRQTTQKVLEGALELGRAGATARLALSILGLCDPPTVERVAELRAQRAEADAMWDAGFRPVPGKPGLLVRP